MVRPKLDYVEEHTLKRTSRERGVTTVQTLCASSEGCHCTVSSLRRPAAGWRWMQWGNRPLFQFSGSRVTQDLAWSATHWPHMELHHCHKVSGHPCAPAIFPGKSQILLILLTSLACAHDAKFHLDVNKIKGAIVVWPKFTDALNSPLRSEGSTGARIRTPDPNGGEGCTLTQFSLRHTTLLW